MKTSNKTISPWFWVPTLYFAEGVPYFVVNNISVMMFTKMGVPNGDMAFFTTLLYFPWFLKGLWGPLVDVVKTKRWWILSMQVLMTALMILLTVTLPKPDVATIASGQTPISMFTITLILFIIAAFASATHDIAADGYYMLAHSPSSQAAFIGVRSTFYRIASVFGQGVLVYIAGLIETSTGDIPWSWQVTLVLPCDYVSYVYPSSFGRRPSTCLSRYRRQRHIRACRVCKLICFFRQEAGFPTRGCVYASLPLAGGILD